MEVLGGGGGRCHSLHGLHNSTVRFNKPSTMSKPAAGAESFFGDALPGDPEATVMARPGGGVGAPEPRRLLKASSFFLNELMHLMRH